MPTAFVLSGGGSYGAMQVGMLRAFAARSIRPDYLVGASVGALNGAWYAARPDLGGVEALRQLWQELEAHEVFPIVGGRFRPWRLGRGNHVFPLHPVSVLKGALGRQDHLVPIASFASFLGDKLPLARLEGGAIPLHVVATDVRTGQMVVFSSGPAQAAVLASSALPGVFPPVLVDGRPLVDGGVAGNTPIDHAVRLGATEIYVLPAGVGRALDTAPRTALGVGGHSLGLLIEQRLIAAASHHQSAPGVSLRVSPSPAVRVLPLDFSTTSELIEAGERLTGEWLDAGAPPNPPAAGPPATAGPGTS